MKSASDTITRFVDWGVGLLSPARAVRRQHFRRMARDPDYRASVLALLRARGYRAAKKGNSTPWRGGAGDADTEISGDLPELRNRAREAERDDPIGSGLHRTFKTNVIGTGLRPQARTGDTDKNRRIEAFWKARQNELFPAEDISFHEAQKLLYLSVIRDGDVFIKHAARGPDEPLTFELVEADRVATPLSYQPAEGHELRDGVERTALGVPVAYHVRKHHPGSNTVTSIGKSDEYARIPKELCKHLRRIGRSGQTRGVPLCHAVLQELRDLDLLMLAALKRTQIAACLAAFITSKGGVDDLLPTTADKYGYQLDQDIEPGMLFKLDPEESIQTLIPNFPTPELVPFIVAIARRIGAAVGVSWQVVLRDFGDSTYSSARTDLLETRQTYTDERSWFAEDPLGWLWHEVMADGLLRGDQRLWGVTPADIGLVAWIGNGWKWVDPLKEAKAVETALKAGLTTLQYELAQLGLDWEEVIAQRQRERVALEAAGLLDNAATAKPMEDIARAVRSGVPIGVAEARGALGLPVETPDGPRLRFNDQDVLQYHVEAGVLTINEIRAVLGLPRAAWGDVPVRKTGLSPVSGEEHAGSEIETEDEARTLVGAGGNGHGHL